MSSAYTEHTAELTGDIQLLYTDSGAVPASDDYTTLIVIHGSAFNGDGFVRLHDHAHKNNLRVVIWNRRDYRGSTKYTDAELDDLKNGRKVFQDRTALLNAQFIEYYIKKENVPHLSADRKTGGFIVMGWSFGVATELALLSDPTTIPKPLYNFIEPYVMSVVIYDPPYSALGYPMPVADNIYDPWTDPDYPTPAQLYDNFQHWVSSYYNHDIKSGSANGLDYSKRTGERTVSSWTPEQKDKYFDGVAAVRVELPAYAPPMQATLNKQTHGALFDEKNIASHFPKVNVFYISGAHTCWYCIWGYMESERLYKEAVARGEKVRPTQFHLVQEGNHFLHYDLPDLLLSSVVKGCRS
ncbi:hypothetical protein AN958_09331 [Leucoagaricus sp. SymC.cos]|nr:hypothetical protein AN958_09331 [Leucoagaricus sp. SymC.cos]